jgi:hypothetical protein
MINIDISKEYELFQEKMKHTSYQKSLLEAGNRKIEVYNVPYSKYEENWTEGALFSLYLLYKYFTNPEEWDDFIRGEFSSRFPDIEEFSFAYNCVDWDDKFKPDAFKNIRELSDEPAKFVLETLTFVQYNNKYTRDAVREIISSVLSEEDMHSFDLYIKMKGDADEDEDDY